VQGVYINWLQGKGGLCVGNGSGHYGQAYAESFNEISSLETKKDITSSPYGLSEILKLQAVKFRFKYDESRSEHIGLIAEEVALVLPEMVSKMKNENKEAMGIDYGKLTSVLIEAVKEQQNQIEELKDTVKSLLADKNKAVEMA